RITVRSFKSKPYLASSGETKYLRCRFFGQKRLEKNDRALIDLIPSNNSRVEECFAMNFNCERWNRRGAIDVAEEFLVFEDGKHLISLKEIITGRKFNCHHVKKYVQGEYAFIGRGSHFKDPRKEKEIG
nr:hypothetical protein [Tanacetum cinerariifolium]